MSRFAFALPGALATSAAAQSVELPTPLNRRASGEVTPGRPSAIGVLVPEGTRSVSLVAEFGRGGTPDPGCSVVLPGGTVLDVAGLVSAGASIPVSAKGVKDKRLPTPRTGLHESVLRGRQGTAGTCLMSIEGKAPGGPGIAASFAGPARSTTSASPSPRTPS